MPTLVFSDSFSKVERTILLKTFKSNSDQLGIADVDASVYLDKVTMGRSSNLGMINRLLDDQFVVYFHTANDLATSVFALGHEAVHLRQFTKGQMADVDDGTMWCGELIRNAIARHPLYYSSLPWEVEAHGMQDDLFDTAISQLTTAEIAAIKGGD